MTKENKKIKNAKKVDGFKSNLERSCIKLLKEAGLNFQYESNKFNIFEGFTPALYLYEKSSNGIKEKSKKDGSCIAMKPISYTPDFYLETEKAIIFIETKGYKNDTYPLKRKLFFKHITSYKELYKIKKQIFFFEPTNIKEIRECIIIINKILKNGYKE